MSKQLQWEPAPYSQGGAFIADAPQGRYYIRRQSPRSRMFWASVSLDGGTIRLGTAEGADKAKDLCHRHFARQA